ncbi:MAG TPA: asparagine synthase C-terminal domain-containing protein, partial [Daejeonella sp.]
TQSPIYSHLLRWNNTSRIRNYLSHDYKTAIADYDPVDEVLQKAENKLWGHDLLTRAQWLEIQLFMSGYLLSSQGDRMAMANSVEGRYPFLDYRVIDLCMKLPAKFKLSGLNEKVLLKRMMTGKLPPRILRRSKQPYRAPISECFLGPDAPAFVRNMLSPKQIDSTGIFDPDKVSQLLKKANFKGRMTETENMAITGILSTQLLYKLFIDKATPHLPDRPLHNCTIYIITD